jgi:hypothetical protein
VSIQALIKVRDDGKDIPSTMSIIDILDLGWAPSRIRLAKWFHENSQYTYQSAYGLSACIVTGSKYLAINESTDEHHGSSLLRLISADAKSHIAMSNTLHIRGQSVFGRFEEFNFPRSATSNVLEVMFRPPTGSDAYLVRIDAGTGTIVSAEHGRA